MKRLGINGPLSRERLSIELSIRATPISLEPLLVSLITVCFPLRGLLYQSNISQQSQPFYRSIFLAEMGIALKTECPITQRDSLFATAFCIHG